ncbi:MAG: DUF3592 domain-containing protein [Chitinophagales bacterium]|nr:DUF3592 domain-containing protein [Chitinophagales bacterium]
MNTKNIFLILLSFLSFSVFSQQNNEEWISTKATIKNIETKRSGRKARAYATVSFTTNNNEPIETMVELIRIPFIGTLKSIGDEITVNYNPTNPALAATDSGKFISKYGMYILILLGVIFSAKTMLSVRKEQT